MKKLKRNETGRGLRRRVGAFALAALLAVDSPKI